MAKRTYELKFKHGSFHDFETELTINRDEQVEIDEDTAGRATAEAIANGRLVVVQEPRKKKAATTENTEGSDAGGKGGKATDTGTDKGKAK
ncbi:MAG TPA: hypothetical protein VEF04_14410 [Blastocatellia bacterium]|nr:hypothetical protein [Blastocatellia bacterium]